MKNDEMVASLRNLFVPGLRKHGFRGTLPHFRRPQKDRIDLLTIQFDKWGGGFVVEIANCSPEGILTPWGKRIPPNRVRAWDVYPPWRTRLNAGEKEWFRFDGWATSDNVAKDALTSLNKAEQFWQTAEHWWDRKNVSRP